MSLVLVASQESYSCGSAYQAADPEENEPDL